MDSPVINRILSQPTRCPHSEEYENDVRKEVRHERVNNYVKLIVFSVMVFLILLFGVSELVGGLITNSLSLLSDAFHMLGDSFTYFGGFFFILLPLVRKKDLSRYTFGFARSELIGALTTSAFILTMVVVIFTHAIEKLVVPHDDHVTNPLLLIIISAVGMIVDFIGVMLFLLTGVIGLKSGNTVLSHVHQEGKYLDYKLSQEGHETQNLKKEETESTWGKFSKLFVRTNKLVLALLVHVIGDFIGSIMSIILGIMIMTYPVVMHEGEHDGEHIEECEENCWVVYLDPIFSLVSATVMLLGAIPLFIRTFDVLLDRAPKGVNIPNLKKDLVALDGVKEVMCLHIWNLTEQNPFCSMNLMVDSKFQHIHNVTVNKVKLMLHKLGVESTTVQIFYDRSEFAAKFNDEEVFVQIDEQGVRIGADVVIEWKNVTRLVAKDDSYTIFSGEKEYIVKDVDIDNVFEEAVTRKLEETVQEKAFPC